MGKEPGSTPRAAGHLAPRDLPARARPHLGETGPAGDEQALPPSNSPRTSTTLRVVWALLALGLTAGLVLARTVDAPTTAARWLAAALGVVFATGLAVRAGAGAQVRWATALAVVVTVTAVLTQWTPLLAGAAFATGVITACLAVLGTRPAPTFRLVLLEVVLAMAVSTAGALAVWGYSVDVARDRFEYAVLGHALVATVALVYRLGGGMHALGRRGLLLGAGALVLLVVVLVYTAALTRYGSPQVVVQVRSVQAWVQEHLGGVPRPVEVLVGIPALAWGVSMRSRRRQGWWVCVLGVAMTAVGTTKLIPSGVDEVTVALSAAYSLVLGLVVAALVIRLERALTGRGGRGAQVLRQEPGRLAPLH